MGLYAASAMKTSKDQIPLRFPAR